MNQNQEAMRNIATIIGENDALKVVNEKLEAGIEELEKTVKEQEVKLKKLRPFEGLIDNAPNAWTFEITDKTLITCMIRETISVKGRWANITTATNPDLQKKATNLINETVEAVLRDTFFNKARFSEIAARQKLNYSSKDDK